MLDHAPAGAEYEVSAGIDGNRCIIEVVDRGGAAFESELQGRGEADPSAERGRGIQLIRALVDSVHFTSRPQVGTVVHLEKRLSLQTDSVIRQLTVDRPATENGPWSSSH